MKDGDYTYPGKHSIMYRIIESLCCIPETNITLYINYTSKIFLKRNTMETYNSGETITISLAFYSQISNYLRKSEK